MPSDASTDATDLDYRALLRMEQEQLQAELSELGFDDGRTGLDYDANFADTSQVTAERGEAEALAGEAELRRLRGVPVRIAGASSGGNAGEMAVEAALRPRVSTDAPRAIELLRRPEERA